MRSAPRNTILIGDASTQLRTLPARSVDCVVTSPPYYLLRDYGVAGQIGLESTVEAWVDAMAEVIAEISRVLKPTGSLWLNLADSFSRHARYGAPPKSLLLAPERLVLRLVAEGWTVRSKVIWAKPNPMPHSVGDRLNTTYEVVFHLVRQRHYYFDLDAIREPHVTTAGRRGQEPTGQRPTWAGPLAGSQDGLRRARSAGQPGHALGKNPGDVWTISTHGYRGAHFATFPPDLVRRPLLATCPEVICTACGSPWRRQVSVRQLGATEPTPKERFVRRYPKAWRTVREIGDLVPCGCGAPTSRGLVLDPFFGTGTVGAVAREHGRDWLGIELNTAYARMAKERLGSSEWRVA